MSSILKVKAMPFVLCNVDDHTRLQHNLFSQIIFVQTTTDPTIFCALYGSADTSDRNGVILGKSP